MRTPGIFLCSVKTHARLKILPKCSRQGFFPPPGKYYGKTGKEVESMRTLERYMPRCRIFLLDGEKFRTNLLAVFFDIPLRRETATKTALLAEVLKRGCEPYPGPQALAKRAEEMYGALWDVSVVKKGDRQLLLFSLEALKAVDVEEGVNFLRDLMLRPLAEKGAFPEETLERQKKILRRKLRGLQDDKREFARRRALEETAAGTPWAVSADGYEEDLDRIDGKTLYEYYSGLLREGNVMAFFCGDTEERKKVLALRKCFPGRVLLQEREPAEEERKGPPHFIREKKDGEQARLVLGFGAEDSESGRGRAALLLMNRLLGGDPDSRLFQEIREKKGLCYDIKSFCYPLSPWLFIQAGIREEDGRETAGSMLRSIEAFAQEGVQRESLEQAKKAMLREYGSMEDQPWAMIDFFAEQALRGQELSAEKFLRRIERMEEGDIRRAAGRLRLKAVYLLGGKEETA